MRRGPDAAALLRRVLVRDAALHGHAVEAWPAASEAWASATFTGARHRLTLSSEAGTRIEPWLRTLPDADLPLRNHLVADLKICSVAYAGASATIELEALTVEV